jgi:hypothetical protein
MLAALIDSDLADDLPFESEIGLPVERRLVFENRKPGACHQDLRALAIAAAVGALRREGAKKPIHDVAVRFKISPRSVEEALKKSRRLSRSICEKFDVYQQSRRRS